MRYDHQDRPEVGRAGSNQSESFIDRLCQRGVKRLDDRAGAFANTKATGVDPVFGGTAAGRFPTLGHRFFVGTRRRHPILARHVWQCRAQQLLPHYLPSARFHAALALKLCQGGPSSRHRISGISSVSAQGKSMPSGFEPSNRRSRKSACGRRDMAWALSHLIRLHRSDDRGLNGLVLRRYGGGQ